MISKIFYIYLSILFILIPAELSAGENNKVAKEFYPYTEWVPVVKDIYGDIYAIKFFDESLWKAEATKDKEIKRVWIKEVYSIKGAKEDIKMHQIKGLNAKRLNNVYKTISRYIFNCNDKTFSVLAYSDYDKQGNILSSDDISELPIELIKWDSIVPDSVGEGLFTIVCMPREVILKTFSLLLKDGCNDVDSCWLLFQRALTEDLKERLKEWLKKSSQ